MLTTNQVFGIPKDTTPRSEIWLKDFAAYGAVGTRIVRFSSLIKQTGDALTWIQDAYHGDAIMANYDLVLSAIAVSDWTNQNFMGFTLNSEGATSQTSIQSVPDSYRLGMVSASAAGVFITVSVTVTMKAGDLIRVHTDGGTPSSQGFYRFTQVA